MQGGELAAAAQLSSSWRPTAGTGYGADCSDDYTTDDDGGAQVVVVLSTSSDDDEAADDQHDQRSGARPPRGVRAHVAQSIARGMLPRRATRVHRQCVTHQPCLSLAPTRVGGHAG